MSSNSSRSRLVPKTNRMVIQASPQAAIEAQGAPLGSLRANTPGKSPCSALASGSREEDMVSGLTIPTVLIIVPTTSANPSHGPPRRDAMATQLPADQKPG